MSERTFLLPDLGEGLTEAEVVSWEVAEGDTVVVDQIIATVETAKAQVELPCPFAGVVASLHGDPGETMDVGAPFITVLVADEATDADLDPSGEGKPRDSATTERMIEEQAGSGNVLIGYGTSEAKRGRRRRVQRAAREATPVGSRPGQAVRVIAPLVRKLAAQHGLDLHQITPSAPGGIIVKKDVEAAIENASRGATEVSSPPKPAEGDGAARPSRLVDERIPITGIRKVIAERLATSRREIPDATTWVDVDATGLRSLKADLAHVLPDARIGYLALLARIVTTGLIRYPELNARVDLTGVDEGGPAHIVRIGSVNLSFAAQGPRGLVVPVVHGADTMSTEELSVALRGLVERAKLGTLAPNEMTGGTFTLNNYGVYGVDGSTPIINHPEAGMLGVGRIVDKPWVVDGSLSVRPVTQLSLTFDHRVCDGGVAGGFLRYVADCVERPGALLATL